MRIVSLSRARPGMRLARAIASRSAQGPPLVGRGVELTPRLAAQLEAAGVFAVYIEDGASEGIEPREAIPAELREQAVGRLGSAFEEAARPGVTRLSAVQVEPLADLVRNIVFEVNASGGLLTCLDDLRSFDRYTLNHSVNVCVLGLAIAQEAMRRNGWRDHRGETRRDGQEARLHALGLGLLLHDVGKLVVPAAILQKAGPLTLAEMDVIKEHPAAGATLVGGQVPALAKVVVLGHHEREDGGGYPAGKRGEDLHAHAQIAAIADVYDAVSSNRVYRARRPTHEAWELVLGLAGTAFPLDLVQVFSAAVAPYPEGAAVMLSDGRRALVARNHREHASRPTVRVIDDPGGAAAPYEIPLHDHPSVTIVDTLADLDAEGPPPPGEAPVDARGEMHAQRIAGVVPAE